MHHCSHGPHSLGSISTYSDTALKLEARGKVSRLFHPTRQNLPPDGSARESLLTTTRVRPGTSGLHYGTLGASSRDGETRGQMPPGSASLPKRETKNCGKLEPDAALASVGSVFDFRKFWPHWLQPAKSARRPIDSPVSRSLSLTPVRSSN